MEHVIVIIGGHDYEGENADSMKAFDSDHAIEAEKYRQKLKKEFDYANTVILEVNE